MSPCADIDRENGFTLVELMIAGMIIVVLLALGILGVAGARKSGNQMAAIASARAYEQAIDRFAAAHGGEVPRTDGVDWPTGEDAKEGPVATIMGERRRFLRTVPEAVSDGRITIGVGSPPPAGSSETTLTYMVDGGGYRIEVRTIGRPECAIYGQGATPGGGSPKAC